MLSQIIVITLLKQSVYPKKAEDYRQKSQKGFSLYLILNILKF